MINYLVNRTLKCISLFNMSLSSQYRIISFLVLTHLVSPAYSKYGPLARVWVLFFPFFAILHPNDLQTVLSSTKHTEKNFFYKLLHNFLGSGLITSTGEYLHLKLQARKMFTKYSLFRREMVKSS